MKWLTALSWFLLPPAVRVKVHVRKILLLSGLFLLLVSPLLPSSSRISGLVAGVILATSLFVFDIGYLVAGRNGALFGLALGPLPLIFLYPPLAIPYAPLLLFGLLHVRKDRFHLVPLFAGLLLSALPLLPPWSPGDLAMGLGFGLLFLSVIGKERHGLVERDTALALLPAIVFLLIALYTPHSPETPLYIATSTSLSLEVIRFRKKKSSLFVLPFLSLITLLLLYP